MTSANSGRGGDAIELAGLPVDVNKVHVGCRGR